LVVGTGSDIDVLVGISAKDAQTGEDLTSKVNYVGSINFNKIGDYPIIYKVNGKTGSMARVVRIVESNITEDLVHKKHDDGRNYLQELDFESVKGTNRNLIYNIYTDNTYRTLKYSWRFAGNQVKGTYPAKISVTIYGEENCANASAIKKAVGKVDYKILSFECGPQVFPAKADITILVDDKFNSSDSLYLYQYTDGKLVLIADSLVPNGAGYLSYSFTKGGDYVLTDKKAGYQETSSETSSKAPVSSTPASSENVSSTQSTETSSDFTSTTPSNFDTSSIEDIPTDAPGAKTVLLVIVLSAIGLMLVTVIAFAAVRRTSR
jgi:hypothetical protein